MSGDTVTLGDHDPLCPRGHIEEAWNGADCVCALIARVREDERKYGMVPGFDLGYAAALRDAEEAVRGAVNCHADYCVEANAEAIEALGGER